MFAPVLLLPPSGSSREAVLQTLLQAHLFGMATHGAYFGLDPQLSRVILFKTLELDHLDEQTAIASIESLVNDLERWQQALLDL
ncbi:type III secretion system chaperone, partial [Acinetobacter baumannii]|uniref:type III secretion system chaperone n=1 Tax=Acinetobacter baumannii TaxID=470 RepID=UPI00387ACDD6